MNSQFGHERDGACTQIQPIDVFYQKSNLKITIQSRLCIFAVGNPAMADQTASGETGNRTEVANYVATLSADLATMAAERPRHPRLSARNGPPRGRKRNPAPPKRRALTTAP